MLDVKSLIGRFTDYFYKSADGNLYKLTYVIASELELIKTTLNTIRNYRDIDAAEGYELDRLGYNVGQLRDGADDHTYRALIKARIARNQSDGTVYGVNRTLSTVLGDDTFTVAEAWEDNEERTAIKVQNIAMDNLIASGNSLVNFATIAQDATAAGVMVDEIHVAGGFILTDIDMPVTPYGLSDINNTVGGRLDALYKPTGKDKI